jgi:hypothetical protein
MFTWRVKSASTWADSSDVGISLSANRFTWHPPPINLFAPFSAMCYICVLSRRRDLERRTRTMAGERLGIKAQCLSVSEEFSC